jgi:hypothetical protein
MLLFNVIEAKEKDEDPAAKLLPPFLGAGGAPEQAAVDDQDQRKQTAVACRLGAGLTSMNLGVRKPCVTASFWYRNLGNRVP